MKLRYIFQIFVFLFGTGLLSSCEKDEMVVDRVVSPVLVLVSGSTFTGAEPVKVTATIYELDKSGILNNTVGIDSIPVTNLAIMIKLNNGTLASLTTDQAGKITFTKTWQELGLGSPKPGNSVTLDISGSHKNQSFTKPTKVTVK